MPELRLMKRTPILPALICSIILFSMFEAWYLWSRSSDVSIKSIETKSLIFEYRPKKKAFPKALLNQKYQSPFSQQLSSGQWNFIFVGYTACPDVCPLTLSILAQVFDGLEKKSVDSKKYKASFVSVDFKKMNLEKVEKYAKSFHEKIKGVVSSKKETDEFLNWLGASYSQSGKLISHSTSIYLVNPYGELVGEFVNPSDPKAIVEKFKEIYDKSEKNFSANNFRSTKNIPGSLVIGGFVDFKNPLNKGVTIEEVVCLKVDSVEIHDMVVDKESKMMKMMKLKELNIPKNSEVSLKRRSKHLMIYLNPKETPLKELNCFVREKEGKVVAIQSLVGSEE